MKIEEAVNRIRNKIETAFDKRLSQFGLLKNSKTETDRIPSELLPDRRRFEDILNNLIGETDVYTNAREKLLDELTFTLFNRIAGLKVMESTDLHHPVFSRDDGNRSFGHHLWLEKYPDNSSSPRDGLCEYIRYEFNQVGNEINLFAPTYLYDLLPDVHDLDEIILEFNRIEKDQWRSDDIMGWLYESYNKARLKAFKDSGDKIEWDKVSLNSQVYTPRWVVEFLVNNSLGKLLLEMYPESSLRNKIKVANAPHERVRDVKPIKQIRIIDPACGSGNFLLYAYDLFYEMYQEQGYDETEIPKLIIENNLHGVDLDDRAVQIAQLGLFIKARRCHPEIHVDHFNVVSTDFYLPEYNEVRDFFEENAYLDKKVVHLIEDVWNDLRQAHRFGSLLNIGDKVNVDIVKITTEDLPLLREPMVKLYEDYKPKLFDQLKAAVTKYSNGKARTFLKSKTVDAFNFLEIMAQKYDVAVANPPYTDSGNYGADLKTFVQKYYKKPYNFYSNLYACFIKVCYNLTDDSGKLSLIHPMTFMYIKTFEDVRRFILTKLHINLFVEYGLSNLFGVIMVDPAFYVLEKEIITENKTLFISLDQYTRTPQEKFKKDFCIEALNDYTQNRPNKHNYLLDQSKLKVIDGWPFIYWISDEFREKFKENDFNTAFVPAQGAATTNNDRFLRFFWEIEKNSISKVYSKDKLKWVTYSKGGPFQKWYGNLWLVVDYSDNGNRMRQVGAVLRNECYYFKRGITYSLSGSKGPTFRYFPENCIFDVIGSCIFNPDKPEISYEYLLSLLNSKLSTYIFDCLNPTAATQVGDLNRMPYTQPKKEIHDKLSLYSSTCIKIQIECNKFRITEPNFESSSLLLHHKKFENIRSSLLNYFNYESYLLSQVLINEAIINEIIFDVYELNESDKAMVLAKEGHPVGSLPVLPEAREAYLNAPEYHDPDFEFPLSDDVKEYIRNLPVTDLTAQERKKIIEAFPTLWQKNNDLEEFCITHQQNPITVWYLFREARIIPPQRSRQIAMELFADLIREILSEDDDGIAPLVEFSGEKTIQSRLYDRLIEKGFSNTQIGEFREILGCDIDHYLEKYFFKELSDRLNLFMYLPKTPFIWHLTSGEYGGIEVYTLIYKWSRDKLLRLRSIYCEKRKAALKNRLIDISNDTSLPAQREKDTLQHQIQEIDEFQRKIDKILADGYNPILDDGVGKNIAPLQRAGLLKVKVLKEPQELNKYLNADW